MELPGIEAAYNTADLHICFTSQHGATWGNTSRKENVLTLVSTVARLLQRAMYDSSACTLAGKPEIAF